MKRDYGISLCKVIAMFMILLCHIATHYQIGSIAQFFQIGVEIFLFISGYLSYTNRSVETKKWIFKRLERIYIPLLTFAVFFIIIHLLLLHKNPTSSLSCFLGYYGLTRIFPFIHINGFPGTTHLWYITSIILCYFTVPLFRCIQKKLPSLNITLLYLVVLQVILSFANIRISYIIVFYIGYLTKKHQLIKTKTSYITFINIGFVLAVLLRLFAIKYFDDSWFYLQIVIPFTNNMIAIALFHDIYCCANKIFSSEKSIHLASITSKIESISYEVFIVHYVFVEGYLNVFNIQSTELAKIVLFYLISFICAILLHVVCIPIYKLKERRGL